MCKKFKEVSINFAQSCLQKCIIYSNIYGKGKQEWNKACIAFSLHPRKLNTFMKTR